MATNQGQQNQTGQNQTGQQQDPNNPGDGSKPFNYRQLEESRDSWKDKASKWQQRALRGAVRDAGFNPDEGIGSLVLESFVNEHPDIDPDEVDKTFEGYLETRGIQPQDTQQGSEGNQNNQNNQPSEQDNLMNHQQNRQQRVQDVTKQQDGQEKSLQQQIAEAQQAGDHETAQQLNIKLASEQLVKASQATQQ